MLKKCTFRFLFTLLAMAGMSAAATMTPVTPRKDGNCYQIGTAAELYGFAAIVNGTNGNTAEPTACGVLTADITVNEHVLKNASGQSCVNTSNSPGSFNANGCSQAEYLNTLYTWTPIGVYYTGNVHPFQGTFDGLGHTISGLFDNNTSLYTGLFGYVSGTNATVSIKNVGVKDSYFRVSSYAGGIVGMVSNGSGELNIENVYSASTFYIKGDGYVGGLLGRVGSGWTLNITNAYNSGSIFGTEKNNVAGLVGYISSSATVSITNAFNYGNLNGYAPLVNSEASVQNSYYLGDVAQGSYGVNKSASDFSDGTVLNLLKDGENGFVWQSGSPYPTLLIKSHSATLHYSSTESETIYFVEGSTASLPIVDKSGNPVLGWYDNEGLTGTKYTEIPASANSDLSLYPKVMKLVGGCYEISDADMLYAFAAAVNNGNATACGKLIENIVVNQNVLTTADGTSNVSSSGEYVGSNSASFRQWTPIGVYNTKPFTGTFDGQGHTISGLYDGRKTVYTGLFGYVSGTNATISIKNVGVEDSYFRVDSYAGGIVGMVYNGSGTLNIENVYSASTFNIIGSGSVLVGGLVGYVGPDWTLNITNAYNLGSIFAEQSIFYCAGLVGYIYSSGDRSAKAVNIKNAFNYGTLSGGCFALLNAPGESVDVSVENSYYLGNQTQGAYGEFKSKDDFDNGMVFAALYSDEDGEVWRQYENDVYPTFVEKNGTDAPSPMHVAVLHYSATDSVAIAYTEGTALTLPTTLPDGSIVVGDWYKSNNLSGDTYTQIAATENGDLAFYAKAMKLGSDGYYEIATVDDLYKFAEIVNNGTAVGSGTELGVKAKLIADICVNACGEGESVLGTDNANVNADGSYNNAQAASAFRVWTPIGNSTNKFQGTFNGKGHTISGLYFNNPETDNVGLFGYTFGEVTIEGVGMVDSYFRGDEYVGSIVGQAESTVSEKLLLKALTVTKSYNKGVVTGTGNVGGLVGMNGNVKFSYNTGSVTGTSNVGGLVGSNTNSFEINGSYNVGFVKNGTVSGNAVLGEGCPTDDVHAGVKNVYFLEAAGDDCLGAYPMTSYEFADGFVATMLHNDNTTAGANIWGQVVGTDKTPLLTGEIVFPITLDNSDNCYEISNADDLYIFAAIVNSGFKSDACGKLTENIVVNENVLTSAGELNTAPVGGFKEWTPIGFGTNSFGRDISFRGTFHGQGHTISGLYFNDTDVEDVGLFGDVSGTVTIDGVGLVDSYIGGERCVGGLVGYAAGSLTISDSYNASSVNTPGSGFGGLVGAAGGIYYGEELIERGLLTISNSYNEGSLNGNKWGGGLVGYADALAVSNSYNAGPVYISGSGEDVYIGGITSSVDDASTVTNSFNYGAISYPTGNSVSKDDLVAGGGWGEVTVTNSYFIGESVYEGKGATQKSTTEFADGTVFAALHSAEGGEDWRQYENDAYPTFAAKTGTGAPSPMHVAVLHYSETDSVVIIYTEGTALTLPTEDKDGNAVIGWTASADGTGDVITEIPASATTDLKLYAKVETFKPNAEGYYEIASADDLYKFAEIVNNGTVPDAKAKLIADICVNACGEGESVLKADGTLNGDGPSFTPWTPIGNADHPFIGTFDGQGYTISGLYFNDLDGVNVGLFGYVGSAEETVSETVSISNVGVEDSYFNANSAVGGVVGFVENVALDMENVYNAAVVAGASFVGGIVGYVSLYDPLTLSMVNVYNVGSVIGSEEGQAGGLVGDFMNDSEESKITIENSYNYGNVGGGNPLVGTVENDYEGYVAVMVTNSFYLGSSSSGDYGTVKSATEFADGTVLIALRSGEDGNVWVQNPNDKYPTIDINAKNANTIVLDWSSAADSTTLVAAGYTDGAVVVVKGGKQFYADGEIYEGILSAEQVATIGDNKLYPIGGVKLETVGSTLVATLNGDSEEPVVIPTDVEVGKVVYNRSIQAGINTTIMLPFEVSLENISSGFTFYKFKRVAENDKGRRYVVKVTTVKDKLEANTPYIVVAKQNASTIEFNASVTLNTTTGPCETPYVTEGGDTWKMRGTYEYKVWETGNPELGRVYGFAAQNMSGTKIGEFVKLGAGASIQPMRVSLVFEKATPNALLRPGAPGMNSFARINESPEFIGIEIEDGEEETTIVRNIKVVPTVVKSNRWFDMKGRALGGKPTAKGTYYYNGQRVIVK